MTVEEHLWFFAKLKRIGECSFKDLVENILQDIDMTNKKKSMVGTLSGGMKRRLSVAIAFIGNAKCIILDEPVSGTEIVSFLQLNNKIICFQ